MPTSKSYKAVSNWVMGPVKSYLKDVGISANKFPVSPKSLATLIGLVENGTLSFSAASQHVFPELVKNPDKTPLDVAQQLNLVQDNSQESILPIVEEVIREFPAKVAEYRKGKKGIIAMFMGEVMKRSKGKADPKLANEILTKKLQEV